MPGKAGGNTLPDENATTEEDIKLKTIKATIERLSVLEIELMNVRDFDHATPAGREMLSHISTGFRAHHDNVATPMNLDDFMAHWRGMYAEMPDIHLEVTKVSSHVDDERVHATVHLDTVMRGMGPDVAVGAMGELQWKLRKTDAKWMLMSYLGLRGPAY
ncbi:Putative NTF2-like domain superfamily protein [Septoria linicola]|uniref:NTF2-like domain superfamily protein n=1 Tax=Septoria linicola TaxID=215465 RepID=A0A9Q9AYX9_9PEZI|nr:Putative NTF2-like domain superfamily protein [Septoria linicola]